MEIIRKVGQAQFEAAFANFPEANFLQAWAWGVANQHEHIVERIMLQQGSATLGLAQVIIKNARRGRYLELPGGPLLDWQNNEACQLMLAEIRQIAQRHGCVFIRLRPQLDDSTEHRQRLEEYGAVRAPMHLHAEHTNILALEPTEDELLAAMRRQTRYEIRRAAKRGIEVAVSSSRPELVERFFTMQSATAQRQGFIPPKLAELDAIFQAFGDKAKIYQAIHQGNVLNMALVVQAGREADYLEAASAPEARHQPGSYAMVWQAIKDAKLSGASRFNLWGIAYSDNPQHRYAGVTTFKRGFGGQDVTYLPAHDIILRPLRYRLNWIIETNRRKRRGL